MTSAYPIAPEVLEERVRALATSLGEWPSQRRVMRECRVGAPRADAALTAVRASGFDPAKSARPLSVVPDHPDTDTTTDTEQKRTEDTPDTSAPATAGASDGDAGRPAGPVGEREEADEDGQVGEVAETPARTPTDATADTPTETAAATPDQVVEKPGRARAGRLPRWPLLVIAAGAFVAIWGGWVGLGELTGFGPIRLLPGIADEFVINSAITLPLGMEAYAAFALRAWLAPPAAGLTSTARRFACVSALGALALGAAGQIAYHLMVAAGITQAPWPITAFVACLPVIVLGCGAALTHLIHHSADPAREG